MQGLIKFFNAEKGFGFINAEDGKEVFVHRSALTPQDVASLRPDDKVVFDVITGDRGLQATNVKKA
jgi:CspA family cold shock protein